MPVCSKAQSAEDTPRRLLLAALSEYCRGLASRIDARARDRPPEALTGQLNRSITAAMNITISGWTVTGQKITSAQSVRQYRSSFIRG